jgi:putative intracellular protease/amidase
VQAKDFAAVVVPGGASAAAIAGEPRMAGFLKAAAAAGALLAGTAEGAATVAGAAAKDARLVTAPSTNALPEFSRALIQALTR